MRHETNVTRHRDFDRRTGLPSIYWLRYHPNAWRVDGVLQSVVPKVERQERLVRWLTAFESSMSLQIGHAFYDTSGDLLDVLNNDSYHPAYAELTNIIYSTSS